jgi:hypothetical protein
MIKVRLVEEEKWFSQNSAWEQAEFYFSLNFDLISKKINPLNILIPQSRIDRI